MHDIVSTKDGGHSPRGLCPPYDFFNSLRLEFNRRLGRMHCTGDTEMDGGDVVGIDLLPAVDVIEQFGGGTLRAHQGRLDLVLFQQAEQVFRLHQAGGGVVVDEEFLAVEFGAAVDESGDAVGDQIAAEIVVVEYAGDVQF